MLTKASMGSVKALKDLGISTGPAVTKAKDLEAAQTALAKAQDNLNTLQTSGHASHLQLAKAQDVVTAAQEKLTAKQADYNQTAKHMNEVIGLVEPKIKGQADAYSKTLPGALAVMKASITDKLLVPLGEKVMPMFERLANWISEHSAQISAVFGAAVYALGIAFDVLGVAMDKVNVIVEWIIDHWRPLLPLFGGIALVLGIIAVALIAEAVSALIAAADTLIFAGVILLLLLPVVAVGAAITYLALLFIRHFGQIKAVVLDAVFFIRDVFESAINFIRDHWQAFAYGLLAILTGGVGPLVLYVATHLDQIKGFFAALPGNIVAAVGNLGQLLVSAGRQMIQGLIDGINSMAGAVGGAIKNAIGNIPGVGGALHAVGIPGFQAGAIVTRPTLALIGERGPEAVVPLHGGAAFGGGVPAGGVTSVTINVYGGDPQAVVNALQQYMRNNGSVPITVRAASRLGAA
jgi:hypothetical protein